jgi:tight adherence protein C
MFLAVISYSIILLLLDSKESQKGVAEQRLDILSDSRSKNRLGKKEKSGVEKLAKAFEDVAPALSKPLTPQNQKDASKLNQRLIEAGFRDESAAITFLAIKAMGAIGLLFLTGGIGVFLNGFTYDAAIKAIVGGGLGFYAPELILTHLANKRKKALFLGLPDCLDLLVVCVEAGLGLDQAFRKVAEEMRGSYRVLSDEVALCNLHLQMGRPRNEVLQDLGNRTGVDDLRSLASLLIQADKFGSSVATALRVQSDSMRVRRQQIAEEKAAKTAVKLIVPLVIFIFPGVFVVLVGPAAIQMMREMFPAMAGK